MNKTPNYYKKDLAYIHDVGFSDFALKSAPNIIEILQENNIKSGLIVDLGCGSGLLAQEFTQANYQVLGIDSSQAMIDLAQKRVPEAEFRVESLFKAEIPPCVAVTSTGECLNYLFDEENNLETLTNLCARIYKALLPGGLFIFDILEPYSTGRTHYKVIKTYFNQQLAINTKGILSHVSQLTKHQKSSSKKYCGSISSFFPINYDFCSGNWD